MTPRPYVVILARAATSSSKLGNRWFVWVPGSLLRRRWVIASHDAPRWV